MLERIKQLPPGVPVYTNGPDAVYLLTGRPVRAIPAKEDVLMAHVPARAERLIKNYQGELNLMAQELRRLRGVVVYLNGIHWRWYYPSREELIQGAPLDLVEQFADGAIYRARDLPRTG